MESNTNKVHKSRRRTPMQLERKRVLDKELQRAKRESDRDRLLQMQNEVHQMRETMDYLKSTSKMILETVSAWSPHLFIQPGGAVVTAQSQLSKDSTFAVAANQPCWPPTGRSMPAVDCLCQPKAHASYGECFERTVYTALIGVHYHSQLPAVLSVPCIPRLPSVSDLLFLGLGENLVSRIIIKMLRRPGFKDLVSTFATFLIVYWVLRYRFFPSPETRADIPEWLRPTEVQDNTPHPIWTDFIHFPQLRNAMVLERFKIVRDDFDFDYSASMTVNWPSWQPLIIQTETFNMVLNPDFPVHVSTFSNWSLDSDFARKYPKMAPLVTIRPHD
ncbi:hypothetical protein BJY01DRAFT_250179 [Aspergillus pseudoustus]|uniref:BZIP domain-containing protein n=1 Tax=Aspergillus pseudoustus TaxID=1810923 RepID=A0ABR4JJ42_9EURO